MFLTVHAAAGIAVATAITDRPVTAFAIGFASHFLVDMIPHGDEWLKDVKPTHKEMVRFFAKIAVIDAVVGLIFFSALIFYYPLSNFWLLVAAVLGSALPDILQGLGEVMGGRLFVKFRQIHHFFHFLLPLHLSFKTGVMVQIMVFLATTGMLVVIF